ncbi:asparaginase [Bradyrhizobium jicamae]|uniref:Asparaginase n=1 Tax=Bradyrhizobium jicamae TaxID=280332 RepID=A0ABS5FJ67_9BRAD|nr:asparaginase [Bradyrhizobium jicamae]MBR0796834.1 asparaginase [Bradyrhizobium jicamae]MBR0935269.1 asparaginase [Bradyrhizobium jicamae]
MIHSVQSNRSVLAAIGLAFVLTIGLLAPPVAAQQSSDAALPRVLVLGTGGTIAGQANARAGNAYDSGKVTAAGLIAAIPDMDKLARISAEQISSIGSQDMNDKVWFDLVKRIRAAVDNKEIDGVVITHGTDTMEETAFFLSNVLDTDIPIVLVGSMRPSTAVGADGPANLYEAMRVASAPESRGRGVLVVLNDIIHGARFVQKTNTTSVDTFRSPNAGPVGYVDTGSLRYLEPAATAKGPKYKLPDAPPLPRVDIVYSHANMDAAEVEDAVKRGAKGIVLAGVGDGNSSKGAIDALAAAAKQGVVVVRSSRVGSGYVNRNVEVEDDKLGFAVALDLNPQKARVLLELLIANGITDPKAVQQAYGQ